MKNLNFPILLTGIAISLNAHAAGFDSSYFPSDMFFGPSRVQVNLSKTTANLKGNLTGNDLSGSTQNITTNDIYAHKATPVIAGRYQWKQFGISAQYQQPFRVNTYYMPNQNIVMLPTASELKTEMFTSMISYTHPSALTKGTLTVTAGVNRISGTGILGTDVTGTGGTFDYALKFKTGYFPSMGVAFEMPEYALKATFMYHQELKSSATGVLSLTQAACDSLTGGSMSTVCATSPKYPVTSTENTVLSPTRYQVHFETGVHPRWGIAAGYIYANWKRTSELKLSAPDFTPLASISSPLFKRDGQYFYGAIAHKLTDKILLSTGVFHEKGSNEIVSLRSASAGGVTSYSLGSSVALTKQLTLSGRFSVIKAKETIVQQVNTTGTISGKFPSANGHNLNLRMEYSLV